jgi:hypothetical protein
MYIHIVACKSDASSLTFKYKEDGTFLSSTIEIYSCNKMGYSLKNRNVLVTAGSRYAVLGIFPVFPLITV